MTYEKSRRQFFLDAGKGFGSVALANMVSQAAEQAKAKRVIFLFMHGGVSHVDTFDPKPSLAKYDGQPLPGSFGQGMITSRIDFRKALMRGSPWNFTKSGKSGLEISDLYPHVQKHADKIAVIRSCFGDAFDHAPAIYLRASGSQFPGRPSLGAWSVYGLGSENKNLPSFVVMSDGAMKSGSGAYGSGYLPAVYQGTVFRGGQSPVLHLASPEGVTNEAQKETLGLIHRMNRKYTATREEDSTLDARVASYELAYRMQSEAQEAFDISRETETTRTHYGTGEFADGCLIARRLVERGVRMVQLYYGAGQPWDAHGDIMDHRRDALRSDQPIAALISDLKSRGLFDETLIVWGGEFGRTPTAQGDKGRNHHATGFSMWLAGGGIRGGMTFGATDDLGVKAVENRMSVHDLHATILHLMGINHEQLTYRYSGRDFRLTDVHGNVAHDVIS